MNYNNKIKYMNTPAQAITRKDIAEVAGALATLFTLCPAMVLGVQMLTRML